MPLGNARQQLGAEPLRHALVGDDDSEFLGSRPGERFVRIGGKSEVEVRTERSLEGLQVFGFVVDEQHSGQGFHRYLPAGQPMDGPIQRIIGNEEGKKERRKRPVPGRPSWERSGNFRPS
jgi:hypothetical protein